MINPDRIGHVVLKVRNLEGSRRFYSEVLGLEVMFDIPGMAFLASHRRDHHEIGLMEVGAEAEAPRGPQVGLAHVAFRLSDEAELIKAYRELKERQVVCCESFIGDGGGPPGVGLQERTPNHPELRG